VNTKNQQLGLIGALICALGALFYSYEYFLRIAPSVMEEPLRSHFGLSATSFGMLSAFYYYAYVPMQLPVGVLLDRYGPRLLLTLACLTCALGTFLFTDTNLFLVSATGRFLTGFGSAFAFVGVLKLATIWLPENRLAMVAGLTSALGTVGAMLGDNILGALVNHIGWVQTMHYAAYFGVILTVVLWLGLRDKKHDRSKRLLQGHGTISNFRQSLVDVIIIAKNPQMWLIGLYGCLVYLPTTVFGELWGIPYLRHAHGLSQEAAGLANSILFFGFMIGAPLMGYISDQIMRRKPPILVGAIGAGIVMSVILYCPNLTEVQIDVLMFLLGMLYSAQCIVFALGRESSPSEAAATAIAMINMLVMLGAMLLQPVVGRLLDWSLAMKQGSRLIHHSTAEAVRHLYTAADYQFAMTIIPIGIFAAAVLVLFIKETYAYAKE
jgi:sugar phosphate permease